MSNTIVIKKGTMKLVETDRTNLIIAEQTYDGVIFTFKGGIQLHCTDNYMPNHTKDMIKNASDSFASANLIFDIANYNKPVSVELIKK